MLGRPRRGVHEVFEYVLGVVAFWSVWKILDLIWVHCKVDTVIEKTKKKVLQRNDNQ